LTEPLGLSQPTVSHHLKRLAAAGLVQGERRGVWTYYRVVPAALAELADALRPREAAGRPAERRPTVVR
jgi:ArsR family transcriptional regulator